MNSALDADVIVVGGGISGLASAWWLQRRGVRVLLLERLPRAGGTIGSTREHGCLLESGPNGALNTTPLFESLFDELGIAGERVPVGTAGNKRLVLCKGRLLALPLSPCAFLSSSLISTRAKLRLLCEPFIGRRAGTDEESVANFVRRRVGGEFLDYVINPFVAGVYAGDPESLSVSAAFPRLHEIEHQYGSLIRAQLLGAGARNSGRSKQSAPMFAFREGMQTMTDAIARRLERTEFGAEVVSAAPGRDHHRVTVGGSGGQREFHARALLFATPAYAAAGLVAPFAPATAEAMAAIPYAPLVVTYCAYRRDTIAHALDGFGFLVPERERRQILGTIFSSSLFENRVPPGSALLTTFVGGARQPGLAQLDESEITELVQAELASMLGAPARAEFVRVRRWPRAIPQYTFGHLGRVAHIAETERDFPGMFFCANYRGGVSIGDCIQSAAVAADRIAAYLQGG